MEQNNIISILEKFEERENAIFQVGENTRYLSKLEEINTQMERIKYIKENLQQIQQKGLHLEEEEQKRYEEYIQRAEIQLQEDQKSLEILKREKKQEEDQIRVAILNDMKDLRKEAKKEINEQKRKIEMLIQVKKFDYDKLRISVLEAQDQKNGNLITEEDMNAKREEIRKIGTQILRLERIFSVCNKYCDKLNEPYYEMPPELPVDKIYSSYSKNQEIEKVEQSIEGQHKSGHKVKESKENDSIKYSKIYIDVSNNKIMDDDMYRGNYKEQEDKGYLSDKFDVSSYFFNNKNRIKRIDWSLLSVLDYKDKTGELVRNYLSIISGTSIDGKDIEQCRKELNEAVKIEYIFNQKRNIFANYKEKKVARAAYKLGIADLHGIKRKSITERFKNLIFRNKKQNEESENKVIKTTEFLEQSYINNNSDRLENVRERYQEYNKENGIEIAATNNLQRKTEQGSDASAIDDVMGFEI